MDKQNQNKKSSTLLALSCTLAGIFIVFLLLKIFSTNFATLFIGLALPFICGQASRLIRFENTPDSSGYKIIGSTFTALLMVAVIISYVILACFAFFIFMTKLVTG